MIPPADHLLASVFYRDEGEKELATRHALKLHAHRSVLLEVIDKKLWEYVKAYLLSERIAPSYTILVSLAEKDMAADVVSRLEMLKETKPVSEEEFKHFLKAAFAEVRDRECAQVLTVSSQILSGQYKPKRGEKERSGYRDAIRFVLEKGLYFLGDDTRGDKLRGDIRLDADEMVKEYCKVRDNPKESLGILTGFDAIDLKTHGIKRGDLWLVGGFASHGKTTTCMNIAHKAVTSGYNVLFVSMEMSRRDVRRMLYCVHSGHSKFHEIHPALKHAQIHRGELDQDAENFYLKHVIPDFKANTTYGALEVIQPDSIWTGETLHAEAAMLHEQMQLQGGLDLIIPDYVGLMGVDGKSEGRNEDLNRLLREMKQMAQTFASGRGVAVLSPFQINREGWKKAVLNDGVYDMTAMSNANEAERSTDVLLTIFTDEQMKINKSAVVCQLKGRQDGCAETRTVHADWESRIIQENAPNSTALESTDWMDNLLVSI